MREKAREGLPTFALTADVSEAHRQVPAVGRSFARVRASGPLRDGKEVRKLTC